MALKSTVDTIEEVAEAFRGEYKEVNGKFVLDIENVEAHPSALALKNALDRVKLEKKTALETVTALTARVEGLPDDFNSEQYEALKLAADGKTKPEEHLAQLRTQLETKHGKEKDALQKKIDALDGSLRKLVIDEGLTKALMDAGIAKEFLGASKALLKEKGVIKLNEEDGIYSAQVETDLGTMPLAKFVTEWTSGDEGKPFVAKAAGGGADGGKPTSKVGEENPWLKEHRNMTKQGFVLKADPRKAEKLMIEAKLPQEQIDAALGRSK